MAENASGEDWSSVHIKYHQLAGMQICQRMWMGPFDWNDKPPKAVVLLATGFGSHSGRYTTMAREFNKAGFACFCHDHPFHGNSAQAVNPCGLHEWDVMSQVILEHCDLIRKSHYTDSSANPPLYLFGHSMGGSAVVRALQLHSQRDPSTKLCDGVILSAPLLHTFQRYPSLWQRIALKTLNPVVWWLTIGASKRPPGDDTNPYLKAQRDDPLYYTGGVSVGFINAMVRALQKIDSDVERIPADVPLLMVYGTEDEVVSPEGGKFVFDSCPHVNDKTYVSLPGAPHQLHNMTGDLRTQYFTSMFDFINKRIK